MVDTISSEEFSQYKQNNAYVQFYFENKSVKQVLVFPGNEHVTGYESSINSNGKYRVSIKKDDKVVISQPEYFTHYDLKMLYNILIARCGTYDANTYDANTYKECVKCEIVNLYRQDLDKLTYDPYVTKLYLISNIVMFDPTFKNECDLYSEYDIYIANKLIPCLCGGGLMCKEWVERTELDNVEYAQRLMAI